MLEFGDGKDLKLIPGIGTRLTHLEEDLTALVGNYTSNVSGLEGTIRGMRVELRNLKRSCLSGSIPAGTLGGTTTGSATDARKMDKRLGDLVGEVRQLQRQVETFAHQ